MQTINLDAEQGNELYLIGAAVSLNKTFKLPNIPITSSFSANGAKE